ncbi:polysaccharide export protein [Sphingomonas koreensis]|nr:polysaccharide export protein [Sphingomonas koreensis]
MQISRSLTRVTTGIALALMLNSCAGGTGSLPQMPPLATTQYQLGTGDEVRIYVYGLDAFNNTTFTVADDGALSLPMIDKVQAQGKTFAQLEGAIKQKLLDKQILKTPMVNVQPTALRPFYILGEVNKPGEYAYRPGMSVRAAVAMAGGYTFRADQQRVAITRTLDGQQMQGRADADAPVQPGDQIQVHERWF